MENNENEPVWMFNTKSFSLIKVDTSNWIQTPIGLMSPELYQEYVEYRQEQASAN